MTTDDIIASDAAFKNRLETLVRTAVKSDTDPAGAWVVEDDDSTRTWEVHITRVEKDG